MRCQCESSHCDHSASQCDNERDDRFTVEYLTGMCTDCVSCMCATGGEMFVNLRELSA